MKVVHIQYRATSSGDFAQRLNKEFIGAGLDSSIITLYGDGNPNQKMKILGPKERFKARMDNRLQGYLTRKRDKTRGMFSYPVLGSDISKLEEVRNADAIYLHWALMGFQNLHTIENLARLGKPMVVILHDMWPITGGCHYSFGCENFKDGCHNCPMFPNGGQRLASTGFRKKMRLYQKYDNLFFVAPSMWIYDLARESGLTRDKPVHYIPHVLDRKIFKPVGKATARHILDLNPEDRIIAFGAVNIDSPYKGWKYLLGALNKLHEKDRYQNISTLIFGGAGDRSTQYSIPFPGRFTGRISDEYAMSLIFNAADVFVVPSLSETFGYVIFEALACGTPVVAFDTGGIPDQIVHRSNGYLARYRDEKDLMEGIEFCLDNDLEATPKPEFNNQAAMEKHLELIHQTVVSYS